MRLGERNGKAVRRAKQAVVLERRARVMKLYFERRSQSDIAREVGISQQQVSEDIRATIADYHRHYTVDTMGLIVLEIERVNRLETTAWEAYEKSCEPKRIAKITSSLGVVTSSGTVVERPEGDAAFLNVILDCIGMRSELLRLDIRDVKDEQEKPLPTFSDIIAHYWKQREAAEKLPKIRAPVAKPKGPLP